MSNTIRFSLKRRFAMHLAAFCILFAGALSGVVYIVTQLQKNTLIDRIVDDRMDALAAEFAGAPAKSPFNSALGLVVRDVTGRTSLPAYLVDLPPGRHSVWSGEKLNHVLVRDHHGVSLYVTYCRSHRHPKQSLSPAPPTLMPNWPARTTPSPWCAANRNTLLYRHRLHRPKQEPDYFRKHQHPPMSSALNTFVQAASTFDPSDSLLPLTVDGVLAGWMKKSFIERLNDWPEHFAIRPRGVGFLGQYESAEHRSVAFAEVVESLATQDVIRGWRGELVTVAESFYSPPLFHVERAVSPYFGLTVYASHLNGLTARNGQPYMWLARRAESKYVERASSTIWRRAASRAAVPLCKRLPRRAGKKPASTRRWSVWRAPPVRCAANARPKKACTTK